MIARHQHRAAASSAGGPEASGGQATFLFVHGGFHGAWCWESLLPLLRAKGHRAVAIDLDYPDAENGGAALLRHWAAQLVSRASMLGGDVIAVAHSRGGLIASQAAELAPDLFQCLVFCGAMLVNDGETAAETRRRLGEGPAPLIVHRDAESGSIVADPASAAATIYSQCAAAAVAAAAVARLRPERASSFDIAPTLSPLRYGRVPRAMIECAADRILPIGFQRAMRMTQPCDIVLTLACDHAPYFSDPDGLSAALDRIARHMFRAAMSRPAGQASLDDGDGPRPAG